MFFCKPEYSMTMNILLHEILHLNENLQYYYIK